MLVCYHGLKTFIEQCEPQLTLEEAVSAGSLGNHLIQEIQEGKAPTIALEKEIEVVRQLAWALILEAAKQNRYVLEGAFLIRGRKLYDFLSSLQVAEQCRISTHFNHCSQSKFGSWWTAGISGCFGKKRGRRLQWNIEDFECRLPTGKGGVLFDLLEGDVTFVKLERRGVPAYWTGSPQRIAVLFSHFVNLHAERQEDTSLVRHYYFKEQPPMKIKEAFIAVMHLLQPEKGDETLMHWAKCGIDFMLQKAAETLPDRLTPELREALGKMHLLIAVHLEKFSDSECGIPRSGCEIHLSFS